MNDSFVQTIHFLCELRVSKSKK